MADRNEADALFATKRKNSRKTGRAGTKGRNEPEKAEMEAEIRRLEEEARRQKENRKKTGARQKKRPDG